MGPGSWLCPGTLSNRRAGSSHLLGTKWEEYLAHRVVMSPWRSERAGEAPISPGWACAWQ